MKQPALNLARKWRSAQFKEIIGQDLVVRILQNSLFKNQFFPVYLFSGQRGCGKTSTARVFASALNCQKLSEFQKNPQLSVPCLTCASCTAMTQNRHPDFLEIDAASYTGVDNIRNIIDTSSFLPILAERKIYLIDEVHMLSKAAFNAFLKILEEPPKFVVFILATTEAQKLPDTVRSRCFQLFFNPVNLQTVVTHLENMCQKETITFERDGLEMIAAVTQGSLRDAINLLEQARFAAPSVTKSVVLSVLGYLDDQVILNMLEFVVHKNQSALSQLFYAWSNQIISMEYLVKRSIEMMYDGMVIKYGSQAKYAVSMAPQLKVLVDAVPVQELIICFDELCAIDMAINKTSKKQLLFESLMLRLSLRNQNFVIHHERVHDEKKNKLNDEAIVLNLQGHDDISSVKKEEPMPQWEMFVRAVVAHVDPVLASMLYATEFVQFDQSQKIVRVATLKKFVLFQDLFIEQKKIYQEYLDRIFGFQTMLVVDFVNVAQPVKAVVSLQSSKNIEQSTVYKADLVKNSKIEKQRSLDVSDQKKWKVTHALLEHFGGTVKEIIKDTHEFDA